MILLYKLVFGRILESYMYVCIRYLVDISERKGQLPRQYYVSCRKTPFDIVIFASLTMFFGKFDVLSTTPRQRCVGWPCYTPRPMIFQCSA